MGAITVGTSHQSLERRVAKIELFLGGLSNNTIRSGNPNGVHDVFDVLAKSFGVEQHGFHMNVKIEGNIPGGKAKARFLYFRFGKFVGASDDAGLPPWDKKSAHFDAEIFPSGKDPAERGKSHIFNTTLSGHGDA